MEKNTLHFKKTLKVLLIFGLVPNLLWAQIPNDYGYQDYKERLPKESFVQIDLVNTDVFDLGKDGLKFSYYFDQKILCLNKQAVGLKKRSVGYDNFFPIADIEATLYYPYKGRYKKEKVKDFEDQAVIKNQISFYDNYREKQFSFENIREGSVIELKVERNVTDEHLLSPRTFSRSIFIENEVYRAKVHKDIDMGFYELNLDSSDVIKKVYEEGDYRIYEWSLRDADIKSYYGQADYEEHYMPQIIPFLKSVKIEGVEKPYFKDLDGLYRWYSSLISKVNTSNDSNIKALAAEITEGIEEQDEKVRAIYRWVQENIKYIAFGDGYGGFIPRDPDVIYDRKFGDCKDMSCLTVNLLRAEGIEAYFSWVGTNSIALNYSDLPSPAVDNHMIVTYYNKNDSLFYLDATDPNLKFGRPSYAIQGREVLIALDKDNYRLDTAAIIPPSVNVAYEEIHLALQNDSLTGEGVSWFSGYFAEDLHANYLANSEEDRKADFVNGVVAKGSNKFRLGEYEYQWDDESRDTVRVIYDFTIEDYINEVGENLYVNLNLSKELNQLKIQENQNTTYFMDYLYQVKNIFELKLGNKYQLNYLPENLEHASDMLSYKITYKEIEDRIRYDLDLEVKVIEVPRDRIVEWNKEVSKLISELNRTVKLTIK